MKSSAKWVGGMAPRIGRPFGYTWAGHRLTSGSKYSRGGALVRFTVGLKLKGKTDHIAVDAEDALIAALKVKTEHPEAVIPYVRQQNRRGDARHPSHALVEDIHTSRGATRFRDDDWI